MNSKTYPRLAATAALILACSISLLILSRWAGSAKTYRGTIASIDAKVTTVMELTAASTAASAAVSAMPGDTATPIAQKLADFSTYFLVVLCALYLEKYLVTILGMAAFGILIPIGLVLAAISLWVKGPLTRAAIRVLTWGVAISLLIPASIRVSDMIYETYDTSIESTLQGARDLEEEAASEESESAAGSLFQSAANLITDKAKDLTDTATRQVTRFIESLAVLIVTSCLIPVLVVLFILKCAGYLIDRGTRSCPTQ